MNLAEHFSLAEFTDSDTATRLGIDNTPPADIIEHLRATADLAELIRTALNEGQSQEVFIIPTSVYRCEELERVLTAKDFAAWCARRSIVQDPIAWRMYFRNKSHPKGDAIDFKAPRFGSPSQIVKFIAARPEIMERVDQIIMEGDWVHVAWSHTPRREVKTASFDAAGTPTYTKGLA